MPASLIPDALIEELAQRGEAIYEKYLKENLEAEHDGEYVVVHVDIRDYAVAKSFTRADREMLTRHPADGRLFGRKIGPAPNSDFVSRLVVSEAGSGRSK